MMKIEKEEITKILSKKDIHDFYKTDKLYKKLKNKLTPIGQINIEE